MLQLSAKVTAPAAVVLKAGVAQLEYFSVKETSTEVDDFFLPHFSPSIVRVFQFLPLPQRKAEDLNCFQQSWWYFSAKDLLCFSSHLFCKSSLILPGLFPVCSTLLLFYFCSCRFYYLNMFWCSLCSTVQSWQKALFTPFRLCVIFLFWPSILQGAWLCYKCLCCFLLCSLWVQGK